jgi:hypothetical protein
MCGDDTKVSPVSLLGSGGPRAMLKHKLLSTAGSAPASAWSLVPKAVTVHASRAVLVPTAGVMPDAWPKVALPYAHRPTAGVQTQLAVDPVPSELPRAIPPSNVTCSRTPKLQAAGGDPLLVPYWLHECKARPQRRLHLSLVAQMDGLVYSLLGVRLERNVFAGSLSSSYCMNWGCSPYHSWSTFVGIFYPSFFNLESMVAAAVSHQCCGLFIVPV